MEIKYSDFEKSLKPGNFKCKNCHYCHIGTIGEQYARCLAPLGNKKNPTGFSHSFNIHDDNGNYIGNRYISLLIQWDRFPNKNGDCIYYKRKWWKFWIKK